MSGVRYVRRPASAACWREFVENVEDVIGDVRASDRDRWRAGIERQKDGARVASSMGA
jgi:hypothetical protein